LLYVAYDLDLIDESELKQAYGRASDVRNLTLALIKYLRNKAY